MPVLHGLKLFATAVRKWGQAVDRFSDITVQHGGMGIAVSVGTSGNIQPLVFDGQCSRNGSP